MESKPKFFTYIQNNSFGEFDRSFLTGIDEVVIVEAFSAKEADERAVRIGLYFNGVAMNIDCPCCGCRWSEQWGDDEGKDRPEVFGDSVFDSKYKRLGYIHYLDGRIEPFGHEKDA